jgi:hypothetical protein
MAETSCKVARLVTALTRRATSLEVALLEVSNNFVACSFHLLVVQQPHLYPASDLPHRDKA